MLNEQSIQGHWNEIKGRIRSHWGELTGDDLQNFDGNVDRLVGLIQRKTGEARESVEHFLEDLAERGSTTFEGAADNVRQYAQQAGERIQERARQAGDSVREGYETVRRSYGEAEDMVRRRPS